MTPIKEKKAVITIMRVKAKANKFAYFVLETVRALFEKRRINILFSEKAEREDDIKRSFRWLHHQISFGEFTPENIRKHDLVVPLNMHNLRLLISYPELAKNNPIPTPTLESVNICDDKYLFYHTLKENGFEDEMPKVGRDLAIPFIVKKKVAHMGLNCYVIDSTEKASQYKNEINDPEYFCQEVIPGPKEYATHLIYKEGRILCSLNVTYIFSNPTYVKGQDKFICNKLSRCPHLELFARILDSIGFEGLCCFNYKEIDGKPYIFEINPRFGGSLSMFFFSFLKYLDFPEESPKPARVNFPPLDEHAGL